MTERIGIVWNPSKTDGERLKNAFRSALRTARLDYVPRTMWFETTPDDPGQGMTSQALEAGCDLIIAAGGDGTVRAVAERLGDEGGTADLAILPLGTGNLLARNLGVPLVRPAAAFSRALKGTSKALDLGEVTATLESGEQVRHGFVVMVGFGIDAHMIAETDEELKARAGWLAYVESFGRVANTTEVVPFSLTIDDGETVEERAHTMLVGNCGTIQGGITLLPAAQPDDGELDLLLLRADNAASWFNAMGNMVWDNGLKRLITGAVGTGRAAESSDSTVHLRGRKVHCELPEATPFEIDGDQIGSVTEFEVTIHPGALRIR